jgi:magnesium chelatase family protein
VEVDVSNGLPMMAVVGLPDAAVNDGKERVRAAISTTGFLRIR